MICFFATQVFGLVFGLWVMELECTHCLDVMLGIYPSLPDSVSFQNLQASLSPLNFLYK